MLFRDSSGGLFDFNKLPGVSLRMPAKENKKQISMFESKVPQMPEGYYSGDKPNPNLRAFVERHVLENPYDPENDDYDVPAFDKPIETTKATAIYNMHTYWSKKPHDAIRQYIRHYTKPGDLVLDPFCGVLLILPMMNQRCTERRFAHLRLPDSRRFK